VIPRIARIDRWLFPKAIQARDQFLGFVRGLVDKVMKPDCTPQAAVTVVSMLMKAHDPVSGQKLSSKEVLAEATTLCVAGSDTSSTAMSATFFYLANTPRAYRRVQEEVRSLFESVEEICMGPKLSKLVYVRACIEEALRMSPPTGASPFREVLHTGATVNGRYFPPGVELGVGIYAIQHNPEYYPSPFEFRPERWLESEGNPKSSVEAARSAFCPFSVGARSCVGKHMALVELTLAVAHAVYTLDFEFAPEKQQATDKRWGIEDEFKLRDHITASKE
jgi:cytochrome P450